jgi:ubiquinone/menaquinone biosynthesis C-methylase UbiE
MTEKQWEMFFEIHHDLPREGPGGVLSTQIAYSRTRNIPLKPRILDIGCGPGAQTVCLAELSKGEVFAVDNNIAFIEQLKQKVAACNLEKVIHPILADMTNLQFDSESFDLIWAEGSIFIIGVEAGLKAWRPLLKSGGTIAFTEASWLRDDLPREIKDYWLEVYPAIMSIEETISKIEELGYGFIEQFVLPESDWWNEYYNPIIEKVPNLRERHKADAEALEVIQMTEKEIDMYRRYSDYYGYVFYIAEKRNKSV